MWMPLEVRAFGTGVTGGVSLCPHSGFCVRAVITVLLLSSNSSVTSFLKGQYIIKSVPLIRTSLLKYHVNFIFLDYA